MKFVLIVCALVIIGWFVTNACPLILRALQQLRQLRDVGGDAPGAPWSS